MSEIVLMSDPRIAAIPVKDCDEPLLDVRSDVRSNVRGCGRGGGVRGGAGSGGPGTDGPLGAVDPRRQDDDGSFAHLREGVLTRLAHARTLLPDGVGLLFVEGYRPPSLQRAYFEGYSAQLRAARPEWTPARIREAASRYVSPPEIAPHSAGAAVDLTLVADGRELDMGTRVNANPEESAGACYTDAPGLSAEARANRRTLSAALTAAGLVNYPTEWWHWSYGDRYWALATGAPHARYGPRERPGS
ncbi:M15 family metallopeptidase [Streptomyces sp. NPDC003300]|uniref:M15 family metallopeptidase n=1 Tax=unclassified Streptomyces TaxID=2593676 RepID=UPI0033BAFE52